MVSEHKNSFTLSSSLKFSLVFHEIPYSSQINKPYLPKQIPTSGKTLVRCVITREMENTTTDKVSFIDL